MADVTDSTVAALDAFVAKDDGSDAATLHDLLEGVDLREAPDRLLAAIFGVMERHPDADLGSPGPLVHAIETLSVAQFEPALRSSVQRRPCQLNLWMVNRILNSELSAGHRAELLALLKAVVSHPRASVWTQQLAESFLQRQAGRRAR